MYTFGPYQLDPDTVRLSKQGQELEVEPQVFNTLLLLIENRHRVVAKNELLADIWQGRVVTDQVITRIIYQLRKILDSTGQDSHIRTVRGTGYQFIAAVTESRPGVETVVDRADDKSVLPRRYRGLWLVAVVMLMAVIWLLNPLQREQGRFTDHPSQSTAYPVVSVLPIEVATGNEELSILVQSFIDYLTNQLALNLNMKVIHPDSLVSMDQQLVDIWAIQQATRSDFIIESFLKSVSDNRIEIHLTLYKKDINGALTPYALGGFELPYPNTSEDLSDLYKQSKLTVRSVIDIIKPGLAVNDGAATETDDPEAYRLVITAHHMSRSDDCQDMQRAEQLLLKAVERDDDFLYAYLQLFSNYYKRVWICGESTDFHRKGLAVAEIIDRLAPNTYQSVATRRSTILIESNQTELAYAYAKDADWHNPEAIYDQSYSLRYAGFLNITSRNLERILQLDPFFFSVKPIQQAPNTLLYQNRFAEHLDLLAAPGNSYHDYFRGLNLFLTGDADAAAEVLQGVVDRTPTDLFGRYSQALLYVIENNNLAAVHVVDDIVQLRQEQHHTDGEMSYKLAQLYALAGADLLALKHLQISVDQGFFPMNYFLIDPALQSIRNREQFKQIVDQATRRHELFAQQFGLESETPIGLGIN